MEGVKRALEPWINYFRALHRARGKGFGKGVAGPALCMILAFVGTAALRIQFPAVSFFARYRLGSSALDIGLLTASLLGARATASLIAGSLYSKRALARFLPPACFLANGSLAYLYPYASSIEQIMGLRAAQGFLDGLAWVTIQIALGELSHPRLRATMYVTYFSIGSLGIALANYLYSVISSTCSNPYSVSMHLSMALFVASAIVASAIPIPRASVQEGPRSSGHRGFNKGLGRDIIIVAILVASISFAMAMPASDVVYIYVRESMGMDRASVTQLIAEVMVIATGVGLVLSLVADRLSEPAALKAVAILAMVACLVMPLATPIAFAAAMILLVSLARSARSIARRIAISRIGPVGIGVVNAANNIGAVAGSMTAGALYDALRDRYLELGARVSEALAALYLPTAVTIAVSSLALAREVKRFSSS